VTKHSKIEVVQMASKYKQQPCTDCLVRNDIARCLFN